LMTTGFLPPSAASAANPAGLWSVSLPAD